MRNISLKMLLNLKKTWRRKIENTNHKARKKNFPCFFVFMKA